MGNRIAIIGAGDLGFALAREIDSSALEFVGFFDDVIDSPTAHGFPVLGKTNEAPAHHGQGHFDQLVMGIGYGNLAARQRVFEALESQGMPMPPYVHPSCSISKHCRLGVGAVVMQGCLLDVGVEIKKNTLLHIGCTVAHDSSIGAHSFLAPSVSCAGFVHTGERCFFGINTTIIDGINIGDDCRSGAGAVIVNNAPQRAVLVGVPARIVAQEPA